MVYALCQEMPDLFALTKILPNDKFEILLATDQSMETIDKFVAKRGLDLHYVQLQNSIESLGVHAYLPPLSMIDQAKKFTDYWVTEAGPVKKLFYFSKTYCLNKAQKSNINSLNVCALAPHSNIN